MNARMEDLIQFSTRLSDAKVVHALGGSGLMKLLGIDVAVNDWDITTEESEDVVSAVLSEFQPIRVTRTYPYTSKYLYRFKFGASDIDLIGGFAVMSDCGIIKCKTRIKASCKGVPLGSLSEWYKIYKALGKFDKCALIKRYVADTNGLEKI